MWETINRRNQKGAQGWVERNHPTPLGSKIEVSLG